MRPTSAPLCLALIALLLSIPAAAAVGQAPPAPPAPPAPVPVPAPHPPVPVRVDVTVDTTEVPDLAPWAGRAKALCEEWYPKIAAMLASDGFTPPDHVRLVFKKDMRGVAGTTGTTIAIASDWVRRHPEDLGMVIHELTHVVQKYPTYRAGWLVEGIADYVRFVKYEPGHPQPPIDPSRSSYREGYRTTFRFLAWVERTYDRDLVCKLNAALRSGRYRDTLFQDLTGKDLNALWKEFAATLPPPAPKR